MNNKLSPLYVFSRHSTTSYARRKKQVLTFLSTILTHALTGKKSLKIYVVRMSKRESEKLREDRSDSPSAYALKYFNAIDFTILKMTS